MTVTENTIEIAERSTRMIIPTDSERAAVKALCIAARKYEERIRELEEALRVNGRDTEHGLCFCNTGDGYWEPPHDEYCLAARKALGIETRTT